MEEVSSTSRRRAQMRKVRQSKTKEVRKASPDAQARQDESRYASQVRQDAIATHRMFVKTSRATLRKFVKTQSQRYASSSRRRAPRTHAYSSRRRRTTSPMPRRTDHRAAGRPDVKRPEKKNSPGPTTPSRFYTAPATPKSGQNQKKFLINITARNLHTNQQILTI